MDVSDETSKLVWDKEELLGKGCQGTVVYGGHFGNTPVAVKRILIANEDLIQRELNALKECRHPRIVQLYDVTYEEQFLIIVLERCASTLETYCQGNYDGPMVEASEGLKQMLEGIAYIHQCKYVHRDVKPSNILISYSGNLKIADFGFSKPMTGVDTFSVSHPGKGTAGWMAPELLQVMEHADNSQNFGNTTARATTAIDIFSLGCVFYFFLTRGQHPFGHVHVRNSNILKGKHDLKLLSKNANRPLIKRMIDADPAKRPDLKRILSGPLFNWDIPSAELLGNEKKFNTWMKSLRNKFLTNKEAKTKANGTLLTKDVGASPKRKSILNFPWVEPNGKTFEPLQAVKENEPSTSFPANQPQACANPATRPKANSVSEPPGAKTTINPRKKGRGIAERKLVASECLESEGVEERTDHPSHSKSMTNLFSLGATSSLNSVYSFQSLASSSRVTLGSILFLGQTDSESD